MTRESPPASTCSSASPSPTPNGKRSREADDEVYLDNFHSHKRYLSEIMATSLNGLTVGDSLAENIMDSPSRDDVSLQCSPMSEDFDDSRYCYTPLHTSVVQPETTSCPASPVSPHRHQPPPPPPPPAGPSAPNLHTPPGCTLHALAACPHPRLHGSDSDGIRFPSSPNDVCHTGDLRRVALLRSVQMRAQPNCPTAYEGEERLYLSPEREPDYVEDAPAGEVDPSEAKLGEL